MNTRTGSFPIGFRRVGGQWAKDLRALAAWARQNGFEAIDVGQVMADDVQALQSTGLRLGSVDLFGKFASPDTVERKEAAESSIAYLKEAARLGAKVFFTVIGGDASKTRAENYAMAVDAWSPVAHAAADLGVKIAAEGWPGGGNLPNLCTTPETCRAFIRDTNPKSMGLNYDPSHLIRLGVDHIRFLKEFAPHVYHVHGKDTELMPEAAYELGLYQPAAFQKPHGFGEQAWRYTIPGHGQTRWTEVFRILQSTGYAGLVSVELEDENFNGSEEGEKSGLLASLAFLRSV